MQTEKEPAPKKPKCKTDGLRILKETKKRVLSEVQILNKKEFGRLITPDDYIAFAITLVKPEHLEVIKDQSLSNKDRLEKRHHAYCAKHGKISIDDFIGILLEKGNENE